MQRRYSWLVEIDEMSGGNVEIKKRTERAWEPYRPKAK